MTTLRTTRPVDRVLVLGLDCASPWLILDRWADHLPNLQRLAQAGLSGPLRSCHPPITVPAWRVMASGLHAGHQGVYGFRNRAPGADYGEVTLASATAFKALAVWERLARRGLRTTLIGLPGTWPPQPVAGKVVAGPLTPDRDADFAWPAPLRERVLDVAPDYLFDVPDFRHLAPHDLIAQVTAMTRDRFRVAHALAEDDDWNLLWLVEIGLDRLYHALWHHIDPDHPRHDPDPALAQALLDYHVLLDREIGALVAACDDGDTAALVVSDHGARTMRGGVCLNVWLQRLGYQALTPDAPPATRFDPAYIDWSRTRAWAWGGYCGRVFVNLQGREPQGVVPPDQLPALLDALADDLAQIPGPGGDPLPTEVHRPADLYPGPRRGLPPDLMVYLGGLSWRAIDALTPDTLHVTENDTGPDAANHDWDGLLIASGPGVPRQGPVQGARLEEIAGWIERLLD